MKKKQVLIALSVFALQAQAQQASGDSIQLNEVIVTGSKASVAQKVVPLSVSQVSREEIARSGQFNILPALKTYVPGLFVTERNILGFGVSTGGSGAITMRGVGGSPNSEVLVLIDGHPQYQGIFGHPLPDAYVASDVEKVEIIRGPGSLLYGSNAMGGVVNIITRKNKREGISGNVGAGYGSYNTQKYYGTLGYKKDKVSLFASVNHDRTDGIRANTDFQITNGYVKAGYELSQALQLTADVSIAKFKGNDNGSVYATPAPFHIDIMRGKASLSLDNKTDKLEGALKLYHNFGEHTLSGNFHSTDRNSGLMFFQTYKFETGTMVTAGIDLKQYGGKVNQLPHKDSLITVNEAAVYGYVQQNLFDKLTLSAGLRMDHHSAYGSEWVPTGGISWYPSESTTFKFNASKGFRFPTVMELYLNMPKPNPNLEPERMMNYEISWLQSFLNKRLHTELTLYKVKGDNMIQVTGQYPNLQRLNVGSFDNKGIEFSARYHISSALMLHANYSYLNLSKAVLAAPRQQLNAGADYSYKIWSVNVNAQYIEKLYTQLYPQTIQKDYVLLNARLTCSPLKNLQLFVMANNLLDQSYQINYGYPMPGINFHGGLSYGF